jgi:hypothetical protein
MARRLFVFAIGGTGTRVLKALTMLLASGIKPSESEDWEIVPVIIDPHRTNKDLKRTERLLQNYQSITNAVGQENGFFGTKITTLDNLGVSGSAHAGSFAFELNDVNNTKFHEYIGYYELDEANRALATLLFSGESRNKNGSKVDLLNVEMDIGFVGNPNIGSIVLNQFKDSREFKAIATNFESQDRVFIISSIFGGTGAAGFPTILKTLRNAKQIPGIGGKGFLQDASVGALSMMPYFKVEADEKSPIRNSDFVAKTKSALHYYKENVSGNKSINALYYLADDYGGKALGNDPGERGQQNDAHMMELIGAFAVIDFMKLPNEVLVTADGKAIRPIHKEFGARNDAIGFTLNDFEDYSSKLIGLRLSQMVLFWKFVHEHLDLNVEKAPWSLSSPRIDKQFLDSPFFRSNVRELLSAFREWMAELGGSGRGFTPYNMDSAIGSFLKGKTVKQGLFAKKVNYSFYEEQLSKVEKKGVFSTSPQKLIKLFFETTKIILTEKFGLSH